MVARMSWILSIRSAAYQVNHPEFPGDPGVSPDQDRLS
jgi:hypothetical protein